jgi:hypothetical protein
VTLTSTEIAVLPSVILPWPAKISRRHRPRPAVGERGYRLYRECLRWEFGFCCGFCLMHEVDLAAYESAGTALFHAEHFRLRSKDPGAMNRYSNCFYICCFCNSSRGKAPNRDFLGRSLLAPTKRVWSEAFHLVDDELQARDPADDDAEYTALAYDVGDPRKTRRRRARREFIEKRVQFLYDTRGVEDELVTFAIAMSADEEAIQWARKRAEKFKEMRRLATDDLLRFRAVPRDRPTSCRCGHNRHHRLPHVLSQQTLRLADLLRVPLG